MKDKKKMIINFLIYVLLFGATYYVIFRKQDMSVLISNFKNTNVIYILIAFGMMILFYLLEALNVRNLLRSFGEKTSLKRTFNSTLIGAFYSAITPASSGGQPMQVYYMSKLYDTKVSKSTLALLIHLFGHQFSIVIIGITCAIFNQMIFDSNLVYLFLIGTFFNFVVLSFYFICIFSESLTNKLVNLAKKIVKVFKPRKCEKINKKIDSELELFHESSEYIKNHQREFMSALLIAVLQVLVNYSIPFFVYKAFGFSGYSIFYFISIQAILFCTVSCIPLPGSVGISETVFLVLYSHIYTDSMLHNALLIHRGISFYLFVLINLVLINNIIISKRDSKK